MEPLIQAAFSTAKYSTNIFNALKHAREKSQLKRFSEFAKYVDTNYETMSVDESQKLNKFINSDMGEKILTEYTDAILRTNSSRVMMALALLYCDEQGFDELNKINFIRATASLDDDIVDFYLTVNENDESEVKNMPYKRLKATSEIYRDTEWDEEDIAIYINELIRLRLLLPDPLTVPVFSGPDDPWTIFYGVGKNTQKYINLLTKADTLLAKVG